MQFSISPAAGKAIYEQLSEQIRTGVARGRLQPDERLPSVRELSQTLVVNPNTIARAYTELEREGTLYTRPGLGVFVSGRRDIAPEERRRRLAGPVDTLLVEAACLGCTAGEVLALVENRLSEFTWSAAAADIPAATDLQS